MSFCAKTTCDMYLLIRDRILTEAKRGERV